MQRSLEQKRQTNRRFLFNLLETNIFHDHIASHSRCAMSVRHEELKRKKLVVFSID